MAKLSIFMSIQARDGVPRAHLQCWGLRGSSLEMRASCGHWRPAAHVHTSISFRATSKVNKVKT